MMTALLWAEREWAAIDRRKFGVGNISLPDGEANEHASHMDGLQVDVRALRKDGLHLPVTWHDQEYDQEATGRLIAIFFSHPFVKKVLFNDAMADPRVQMWPHHDNHFHVELK
jgi:murein endopeptidase